MLLSRSAALVLLAGAPLAAQELADVVPIVRASCAACHGDTDPEAGLDLLEILQRPLDADALDVLLDVRDVVQSHEMPPADEPQPSDADRALLVAFADRVLAAAAGELPADPGDVTMRRLSRHEYANTIRDLLGVPVDIDEFPADDLAYGFDNVGDALTLSTLHLEKYAAAAGRIAARALPDPDVVPPPVQVFDALQLSSSLDRAQRGDLVVLYSRGEAACRIRVARPGRYRVHVHAFATQAGDESARMALVVDGRPVEQFEVEAERSAMGRYGTEVELPSRSARISAEFVNDFYDPDHPDPGRRDRNLYVAKIEIEGPIDVRGPTAAERWLRALDRGRGRAESRARPILQALMDRAWRRPVSRAEVARVARVVRDAERDGESFDEALRWGVQAVLVSPYFLFRVEPTGAPDAPVVDLDGHAIATRLSYFLWSTLPDQALREVAGELGDVEALVAHARRMLADRRSGALATNFASQWLELRRLADITPDPDRFPQWNPELARSARRETEQLFDAVLREDLPATTLLDADFTFVDARLAAHYGLPVPSGDGFERVPLAGRRLGGVLGHASFLTLTSNPTRTSPVKRGKWILDNLLDDPPPPPPPGFDSFEEEAAIDSSASLREQMARHRERPACAVCHTRMDALGLGLQRFDAIGRARETDTGGLIDAGATLPDGRRLLGAEDLRDVVRADPAFRRALLRKLFVYAIGRGIRPADAILLEARANALPADSTLEEYIVAIVRLDAFRRRSSGT